MNLKEFYEDHKNYSLRTLSEYFISPGIKCKFDLVRENLGTKIKFIDGIDLGCSGDSILFFLENIHFKSLLDIATIPLKQYKGIPGFNPLSGDLSSLPYRDNSFDFISALDVLEHIKDDYNAVSEMSRILKLHGIIIITVPHRMKYYTKQDQLIGHYRRYELNGLISLFERYHLSCIRWFGIYGQFMKIADVQSFNPDKTEESLITLRKRYIKNAVFRKIWDMAVKVSSKIMKIDAKYQPKKKRMNIGLIFKKI